MHRKRIGLALLGLAALGGCATARVPTADTLATLPVVTFGDPAPNHTDYVLYFPAGKPIPSEMFVRGTALVRDAEGRLEVALKRDLYVYKGWASFDKKEWRPDRELITVAVLVKVPSPVHPRAGQLGVQIDFKEPNSVRRDP